MQTADRTSSMFANFASPNFVEKRHGDTITITSPSTLFGFGDQGSLYMEKLINTEILYFRLGTTRKNILIPCLWENSDSPILLPTSGLISQVLRKQ